MAAGLWIAAGVDINGVSWLSHSTAKLTLDTYGHLTRTDADRDAWTGSIGLSGTQRGPRTPKPRRSRGVWRVEMAR